MIHEFGVFIPGSAPPDERTIDVLARAAGLSRIDARMLLASPLPRRVRSEATSSAAADRVRLLREGGLDAFVVTRKALARVKPARVKSFRFDAGGLRFDPPEPSFEPGELRLIVHGEIQTRSSIIRSVRVDDFDGPPVVERTTVERRSADERFLHLYGEDHARVVEIRPQRFNFRGLGAEFGPVLSGNVAAFLDRLRAHFPEARYDDTLRRFPPLPDDLGSDGVDEHTVRKEGNEAAALRTSILIALDILRR